MDQIATQLRRQQEALATFGSFAFRERDLQAILNEAARVCAIGLGADCAKICQYRDAQNDLLIVAGFGWQDGVVNRVVSQADESSPQGRAYVSGEPVVCFDLTKINGLTLPDFYRQRGIISTVDVIIKSLNGSPFGVLEVDHTSQQNYDQHDIDFLTGFANVLAEAVATADRDRSLHMRFEQIQALLIEKDQLLTEKNVMVAEVQHRVRNNLQLVGGMLASQIARTHDVEAQAGLRVVQARVAALAKVHDHLLGIGLCRTINFAEYAQQLCRGLPDLQPNGNDAVALTCDVTPMTLDLNVVTSLGLAMTELVSNCYRHAFPTGKGRIAITGGPARRLNWGELRVSDDGIGSKKTTGVSKRHGIGLIHRLMEQVAGSAEVQVSHGTEWTLMFPAAQDNQPAALR